MKMSTVWILLMLLINCFLITKASLGDRSLLYGNCNHKCRKEKCDNAIDFKEIPSLDLKLLMWTCKENCTYYCMWETVSSYTSRGFPVPQFHGKWPFIRVFGIQEPASVIFSILNFYAHLSNYNKFWKEVGVSAPMFFVWTWLSAICLHGWFWSAVFHARDTETTEAMDYSCAFAIVLTLLYCLLLRICSRIVITAKVFIMLTGIYFAILYSHLSHLWSGRIDYGYNMQYNIAVGFVSTMIVIVWWYRNYKILPHLHIIGWFIILTAVVTLLEVADFPPILWIFDAHSLWHAATIPITYLLYRFIRLDCCYLKRQYAKLNVSP